MAIQHVYAFLLCVHGMTTQKTKEDRCNTEKQLTI